MPRLTAPRRALSSAPRSRWRRHASRQRRQAAQRRRRRRKRRPGDPRMQPAAGNGSPRRQRLCAAASPWRPPAGGEQPGGLTRAQARPRACARRAWCRKFLLLEAGKQGSLSAQTRSTSSAHLLLYAQVLFAIGCVATALGAFVLGQGTRTTYVRALARGACTCTFRRLFAHFLFAEGVFIYQVRHRSHRRRSLLVSTSASAVQMR